MAASQAPVVRPSSAGRAVRYGCGTALAIVTALVVGGALLISQWVREGNTSAPAPAPAPVLVPIAGSVVLGSDGVTIMYSDPNGLCRSASLAAAETGSRVTLSLHESDGPQPGQCEGFGLLQLTPVSPLDAAAAILPPDPVVATRPGFPLTVTLASPLGRRRLVDSVTGRAVPYFDQRRALALSSAASGWQPALPTGDVSSNVPYFGGLGAAVLADYFVRSSGISLTIVQVIGGGWHPPSETVTRRVTIRGHSGLAAPGIIVWTEAGRTVAVIGQGPLRLARGAGAFIRAPMPFAKLLVIANGLEGGTRR